MPVLYDTCGNRLEAKDSLQEDCCSSPGVIAKIKKINRRHKEVTIVYQRHNEEIDLSFEEFGYRGFVKC